MMCMTQHLKAAHTIAIWKKVVVASWGVALAVAWLDMVDFAVSPCGGALWSYTAILGASLGGRASKTPHMFALPRSPTLLRAPSSST